MRVLHVVTAFPRFPEDPVTPWLVELIRRQREAGLDARVLAPSYRGGPGREADPGIPVRRFRYAPARWETLTHDEAVVERLRRRPSFAGLVPPYLTAGCFAAASEGRRGADVAHVHWPMPHALFGAAARAASRGRTAVVCSFYSVELNWVSHRLRPLLPFLRWTARTADAVTAISTSTAEAVRRLAGKEAVVIPYGAATADDGEAALRPALAHDGPLRILFVGRLVERKGVEVLVDALPRLRRDAILTVVGKGDRAEALRRRALAAGVADRVLLRGSVGADELRAAYRDADVVVLPAVVDSMGDTEGLGVVLLEALRFERPVVASAVGGIRDVVQDGRTGWLVPPADPEALAGALDAVADDPGEARARARAGRRDVARRFGWDRVLAETTRVYESAVARRRHRDDR